MDASARGSFVWHELITHDTAKAAAFYSGITGWKTLKWEGGADYMLFVAGKDQVAGLAALSAEARADGAVPAWLGYVGTADVDAIAAEAQRLGGKIIRAPADIPGTGRFAVIADPQGVAFGIYRSVKARPSQADRYFAWHELVTTDQEAAFRFYHTLFGWDEIRRMDMGAMGDYVIFGWDGAERGGMMTKPKEAPVPYWMAYKHVTDARRTAESIKSRGGTVIMGPHQVPGGGWIVLGIDPTGAMFAVHSPPEAMQAADLAPAKSAVKVKTKAKRKAKVKARAKVKPKVKAKPKAKAKTKQRVAPRKKKPAKKK